jgi:hypothetical protein
VASDGFAVRKVAARSQQHGLLPYRNQGDVLVTARRGVSMRRIFYSPIAALIVLALIATLLRCAYVVARSPISPHANSLTAACWTFPVLIWMDSDALRKRRRPCFDFGLFLVVTFPLSVVWYCFWSRGLRGMKLLLGLTGLLFVPAVAAALVEAFLS